MSGKETHGRWDMGDMLDFIEAARAAKLNVSMSRGESPFSVGRASHGNAWFVRFWWDGRVDCRRGPIPDLGKPKWLDERNRDEWYSFLGMETP